MPQLEPTEDEIPDLSRFPKIGCTGNHDIASFSTKLLQHLYIPQIPTPSHYILHHYASSCSK